MSRGYGRGHEDGPRDRRERRRPRNDLLHSDMESEGISRRSILFSAVGIMTAAAVWKLADYQIFNVDRYRTQADYRRLATPKLFAKRGTIYDRNGNVLALSVECKNVYANPQSITSKKEAVAALVEVLGIDEESCREKLDQDTTFVYIKYKVDQEDADLLAKKGIEGIGFEPTIKRIYPYGTMASQVIGALSTDNKAISGLELYYDEILGGEDGSMRVEHGLYGDLIAGGEYEKIPPRDGTDIVLTLDANIQRAAEDAMAEAVETSGAKYGSAIVCDPTTGEILAACSYPTYNPADLSTARTEDMNLRVVTDAYEPGSVFKALVSGMAIDLGRVDPDTEFDVPATVMVGSDEVWDVDRRDFAMTMTLREIMRRSSNTGMVLVGERIGEDDFDKYLKKYGLGKPSGIDFAGESLGIIRDRSEYDGSSLGSMSFGQGIAVSPIEILRAMTGIANKGVMVTPHFLKSKKGEEVDWSDGDKRAISAEAAEQVVSMMETVVKEGTGTAAQIEGYSIAGKTGTAERAGEGGGYEENNNMASFLGFVSPSHPKAMVYVTLDGTAYTSSVAMPPFRSIMQAAIDALGIKPGD
ncbi:MAG: penicillin-binding protein 2 [Collinsella sp.]|nr:penicillin-binding protein 2 [Collinsella sp.]